MGYDSLTTVNFSEGLHVLLIHLNNNTNGIFMNVILFMIWTCLVIGSYQISSMRTGKGDFPQAFATSSFVMVIITTILLMNVQGLIGATTSTIIFAIAILSIAWFLLSKE